MEMFQKFNTYLEEEQETREKIREIVKLIDNESKEAAAVLQVIHTSLTEVNQACLKVRGMLEKCKELYIQLASIVPPNQYYRFSDHWNWTTQRLVSIIALVVYLEAGFLVTRDTCAEILGLKSNPADGFHLDIEFYLMGILLMTDDLSRFAVNSASMGDYNRVQNLQNFIGNINSGFRLLNLKNDALRKKFDSLKYSVKRIEEIVYDLAIRNLINKPNEGEQMEATSVSMKED
ncbi:hypothetical protein PVAND_004675 [Polypedilum vanderplanki]|uniref:Translin n=1 Tax=Polypedilum vanderplanki TaxID=319348 RepID=A0A9J6BYU3_POLVA|nr:hypothetical protein PVAND_004675 [Polypedilum vanderplanki]